MTFLDSLLAAGQSLRVNIMRSVLTTLGIIIGVAAVISMVSIGAGAQARVDALIQSLGSNLIMLSPGTSIQGGAHMGGGSRPSLTEDDAEAIVNEIPAVEVASPSVSGSGQVIYGNMNWFTRIEGVTPDFTGPQGWSIAAGRSFTQDDVRGATKVVLLGDTVAENLFPGYDPVGETVRINRVPFKVIGTLVAKGDHPMGRDQDDIIFVPLSTAKKRILGGRQLRGKMVSSIAVQARSAEEVAIAEEQVTELLRQRHRIRPNDPDDFRVRNIAQMLEARAESSRVMTLLLAAVASVSLLVGGIGIMNIMLVSVTERTREIGLRMAVGASSGDILTQFLVEAMGLSLIGGCIGIALGIAGSEIIARIADWPMVLEPAAIVIAFGFSALVGVFFGFYPARKASRLDPIEALRYE